MHTIPSCITTSWERVCCCSFCSYWSNEFWGTTIHENTMHVVCCLYRQSTCQHWELCWWEQKRVSMEIFWPTSQHGRECHSPLQGPVLGQTKTLEEITWSECTHHFDFSTDKRQAKFLLHIYMQTVPVAEGMLSQGRWDQCSQCQGNGNCTNTNG